MMLEFEVEVRHAPNTLVPRDPNPRERGFGPVNSDRWRGASRPPNGTGVIE